MLESFLLDYDNKKKKEELCNCKQVFQIWLKLRQY